MGGRKTEARRQNAKTGEPEEPGHRGRGGPEGNGMKRDKGEIGNICKKVMIKRNQGEKAKKKSESRGEAFHWYFAKENQKKEEERRLQR